MKSIFTFIFPDRLEYPQLNKFMNFPGEKLILAAREHWFPLEIRILKQAFGTFFAAIITAAVIFYLFGSPLMAFATAFLVALVGVEIVIRELVHWHFHFYIVTDHKLLEAKYDPFFSEETNAVLIDQIRCTEIDAELHGIIAELLDIGSVAITFDRPTHQEIFMLKNIRSPRKVATLISSELYKKHGKLNRESIWFRNRNDNKYRYVEGDTYGILGAN